MSSMGSGTGRGTRYGIGLQVALGGLFALVALVFANYLATRQGIRQRFDLTERGVNTISTAARGVLGRLEEPLTVDVFFRPVPGPLGPLQLSVMERVQRMLELMEEENELLDVRRTNPADRVALDQRLRELRLRGFENCVVVTSEERRVVLRLAGDLAEFDIGNLDPNAFRPASIRDFRAEERIVQAILEVVRNSTPKIYVTSGHGERDAFDEEDPNQLGRLSKALEEDGFEVAWWRFDVDGALPDDAAVVAVLGPTSPLPEEERGELERFVNGGGRLIIAPPNDLASFERSGLQEWVEELYGVELSRGVVCTPAFVEGRVVLGQVANVVHQLGPRQMSPHPITDPLREGERVLRMSFVRRARVVRQPGLGTSLPLLVSSGQSWLDVPDPEGNIDWFPQETFEEIRSHPLAVVSEFETDETMGDVLSLQEEKRARVVVLGGADVLCNQLLDFNADFALNLFNWAADREYRVAISPRDPDQRRLPVTRTDVLARLNRFTLGILPGICALAGIALALLRARSGRVGTRPRA